MASQLENIMKHFGTFYMTEENDDYLAETLKKIVELVSKDEA